MRMGIGLRPDVHVTLQESGAEVIDGATGLHLQLEGDWAALSRTTPLCEADGEAWNLVHQLGLLDEGLTLTEIQSRQLRLRQTLWTDGQAGRVQELLRFCVERVPYYRQRGSAYDAEKVTALEGLQSLPLMGKPELRANFPEGLVADGLDVPTLLAERKLELAATSGTTGERLQVLADMELDSMPSQYERLWGLPASEETPRTAVFTTPTCLATECHLGKSTYEERLRGPDTLFLNSLNDLFSLKPDLVKAAAEEMTRFRPDFLLINPTYLHWLGRRAKEWGIPLPRPRLLLSCYQYLSRIQRRALRELFDAPVYSYYFATDLGGCRIAVECNRGRLHVREDQALLEVVGPDGKWKPGGEVGSFALTSVANRVMPLVRYTVGDVGRFVHEGCDCAIAEWPCIEMHGRIKDLLWLGGRWVTTREVDEALGEVADVDFYRCVQTEESALSIQVVPSLGADDPGRAVREAALRLEGVKSVAVNVVKRLDPEPSLKFRLTESRWRAPPELL